MFASSEKSLRTNSTNLKTRISYLGLLIKGSPSSISRTKLFDLSAPELYPKTSLQVKQRVIDLE